jgi:hypothetical protein
MFSNAKFLILGSLTCALRAQVNMTLLLRVLLTSALRALFKEHTKRNYVLKIQIKHILKFVQFPTQKLLFLYA